MKKRKWNQRHYEDNIKEKLNPIIVIPKPNPKPKPKP